MMLRLLQALLALSLVSAGVPAYANDVRVKDLGRFLGWRDNPLVGYGIVTGLAGSGDSPRSEVTKQALRNVLSRLGASVTPDQMLSRNVAAVMVTATLPPSASIGDRIDVTVTSIGDARSLVGGTLLMTPLLGPDQRSYALAQGSLVVGGYRFDADLNVQQKNYPTSAVLPDGATVEDSVTAELLDARNELTFVLKRPDFTTAERIATAINASGGIGNASVKSASAITIRPRYAGADVNQLIATIETLAIVPDQLARVVINERTGTVVAGGAVQISSVVISQGDIRVTVSVNNEASQPVYYQGFGNGVRSLIVTNTTLEVNDQGQDAVIRFPSSSVADLISALSKAKVNTRGMIAILQAMKAAGALHADIVVQ